MKKAIIFFILTQLITFVNAGYIPPNAMLANHDPSHSWKWWDSNWWNEFNSYQGDVYSMESTGKPTIKDGYNSYFSLKETENNLDGWTLYTRRIFVTDSKDYSTNSEVYSDPNDFTKHGIREAVPYFVLYNKYRGLLRYYIYNYIDDTEAQTLESRVAIKKDIDTFSNHHYFLGHGEFSLPENWGLPHHYNTQTMPLEKKVLNKNIVKKWFVLDIPLDYQEKDITDESLIFHFETNKVRIDDIQMTGTIKEPIPTNDNDDLFNGVIGTGLKKAGDYLVPFVGGMALDGIKNQFVKMLPLSSDYDKLREKLEKVTENDLSEKIGGLDLITKVARYAGHTTINFKESKVQLDGNIQNISPTPFESSVPILGTNYDNQAEIPYVAKSEEIKKLGLFKLKDLPKATLVVVKGTNTHYIHVQDPVGGGNLVINPESGNKLVNAKYKFKMSSEISRSTGIPRSPLPINQKLPYEMWGILQHNEYGIDYDEVPLKPFDEIKIIAIDPTYSSYANSVIGRPKMMMDVYLKFEYTDGHGQKQYNEFITKYEVDVHQTKLVDEHRIPPYIYEPNYLYSSPVNQVLDNSYLSFSIDDKIEFLPVPGATGGMALYNQGYTVDYSYDTNCDHLFADPQYVSAEVYGPGELSFRWMQNNFHVIGPLDNSRNRSPEFVETKFLINDIEKPLTQRQYLGQNGVWFTETIDIPAGQHTLRWAMGDGYLDNISYINKNIVPTIITPLLLN
ncbi:MAG: hypothetical protein OCC49_18365 [Fibrobacterales bacterium]